MTVDAQVLDLLAPDAERLGADIARLSGITDDTLAGWTRQVFSDPYRDSRAVTRGLMIDAGLETEVDPIGNIIGRLPGRHPGQGRPLVVGSHTDTVREGGRFDGIVGVMSAIEIARRLRETGTVLDHDLVVIDFLGEEPNRFGLSCVGSRAISGDLTADQLGLADPSGEHLAEAISGFGADPSAALQMSWAPDSVHAYIELHIEQGPLLEQSHTQIGVVTAIAGIERLLVSFRGRSDHAGTMPMDMRHDALSAAAAAILTVERVGCGAPIHGVATTGRLESGPGAVNVVPEEAQMWAELRSTQRDWLQGARGEVVKEIAVEAERRGVESMAEWLSYQDPVPATQYVQDHISRAADALGLSWKAVPSGAGHDAAHMARLGPMGMIFVPSVAGRSHCPEELTAIDDIAAGAHVLAATIVDLDRSPRPLEATP